MIINILVVLKFDRSVLVATFWKTFNHSEILILKELDETPCSNVNDIYCIGRIELVKTQADSFCTARKYQY